MNVKPVAEHGASLTRYHAGCRCEPCRAAKKAARKRNVAKGKTRVASGGDVVHGSTYTYSAYDCRCERCREAHRKRAARTAARANVKAHGESGYGRGCRCDVCRLGTEARARRQMRKSQDVTLPTATRRNHRWTGPELEIAARKDLTIKEAALILGRSWAGVKHMRYALNHEPKFQLVAGLGKSS